jgi:hypothetical protein
MCAHVRELGDLELAQWINKIVGENFQFRIDEQIESIEPRRSSTSVDGCEPLSP